MTIKDILNKIGAWPFIRVSNSKGKVIVDMEKYAEQIKQEAYEEAAKICDELMSVDEDYPGGSCAQAIRALKDKL